MKSRNSTLWSVLPHQESTVLCYVEISRSEGTARAYIFLVDNQDIALNIVMSGYHALCLVREDDGYYFSVDSFIEEMRNIQLSMFRP